MTSTDPIRAALDALEKYDDANPYHDCRDILAAARAALEGMEEAEEPHPPLWKEMREAYVCTRRRNRKCATASSGNWTVGDGFAAEILALRNWLKMQLPEGGAWYVLLTAEAERAKGSND